MQINREQLIIIMSSLIPLIQAVNPANELPPYVQSTQRGNNDNKILRVQKIQLSLSEKIVELFLYIYLLCISYTTQTGDNSLTKSPQKINMIRKNWSNIFKSDPDLLFELASHYLGVIKNFASDLQLNKCKNSSMLKTVDNLTYKLDILQFKYIHANILVEDLIITNK